MGRRGRPPGRTAQGDTTREAIFQASIARFTTDGFEASSVRRIAADAGVSAAALYRHFPSKQAVVLELYDRLSTDFATGCRLPSGRWQPRFFHALRFSLATLSPHRALLRAVLGELLTGEANLLNATDSRDRVRLVFIEVVMGARRSPSAGVSLGHLLYLVQLGVLLLWCLDRSQDQRATERSLDLLEGFARPVGLLLSVPGSAATVDALVTAVESALFAPGG